jgi:hypothetical protein
VPGDQSTKIIEFPNISTLSVPFDNLIDEPLLEHIQINYLYENTQMDIRGNLIPRLPLTYIDFVHPFNQSINSQARMIIRYNSTFPYYFDYTSETTWVQDLQQINTTTRAIEETPPHGLTDLDYSLVSGQ